MARPVHQIHPGSREPVSVTLTSELDPTGDDVEWLATVEPADPDPDDAGWTAGSWPGSWSATTGRVEAVSCDIGDAPAGLDLDAIGEGEYVLWCRWISGTSRPVKPVATIRYGF